MKQHKVYSINDTDQFNAKDYSMITEEVAFIIKQTAGMLPVYKEDHYYFLSKRSCYPKYMDYCKPFTYCIGHFQCFTCN